MNISPSLSPACFAVAIVDTGIAPALMEAALLLPGINFSQEGDRDDTADLSGHGTALAQTVHRIAPLAPLLPIKLMDGSGVLRDPAQVETAFEWIVQRRHELGIGIVCAALANFGHYRDDGPFRGSRLQEQIAELRAQGVPVVVPAGNWYAMLRRYHRYGMAWPAILRETVSVGAVARTPGEGLRLTEDTQRLPKRAESECRTTLFAAPEGLGNTSGAAAVIAGCLAALRQQDSALPVEALIARLCRFRQAAGDGSGTDWPAIDAEALRATLAHQAGRSAC